MAKTANDAQGGKLSTVSEGVDEWIEVWLSNKTYHGGTMAIHPKTTIGHIHLTVADLDRSLAFYRDLLGFEVTMWYGDSAVFLSAGGYHHHLGLNTWAGKELPLLLPDTQGCITSLFCSLIATSWPGR